MRNLTDLRCVYCDRLLARVSESSYVEIRCPKCKTCTRYDKTVVVLVEMGKRSSYVENKKLEKLNDFLVEKTIEN